MQLGSMLSLLGGGWRSNLSFLYPQGRRPWKLSTFVCEGSSHKYLLFFIPGFRGLSYLCLQNSILQNQIQAIYLLVLYILDIYNHISRINLSSRKFLPKIWHVICCLLIIIFSGFSCFQTLWSVPKII